MYSIIMYNFIIIITGCSRNTCRANYWNWMYYIEKANKNRVGRNLTDFLCMIIILLLGYYIWHCYISRITHFLNCVYRNWSVSPNINSLHPTHQPQLFVTVIRGRSKRSHGYFLLSCCKLVTPKRRSL